MSQPLRFDSELASAVASQCPDSMVAGLSAADDEQTTAWARTIEQWADVVPLKAQQRQALLGCNDERWWSTFFELMAGRLLMDLGYDVRPEHYIAGLTPDWFASHPDGDLLVEVFALLPSAEAKDEDARRDKIKLALGTDLDIPARQVAVQLKELPLSHPTTEDVGVARERLGEWVSAGEDSCLVVETPSLKFSAYLLPGPKAVHRQDRSVTTPPR